MSKDTSRKVKHRIRYMPMETNAQRIEMPTTHKSQKSKNRLWINTIMYVVGMIMGAGLMYVCYKNSMTMQKHMDAVYTYVEESKIAQLNIIVFAASGGMYMLVEHSLLMVYVLGSMAIIAIVLGLVLGTVVYGVEANQKIQDIQKTASKHIQEVYNTVMEGIEKILPSTGVRISVGLPVLISIIFIVSALYKGIRKTKQKEKNKKEKVLLSGAMVFALCGVLFISPLTALLLLEYRESVAEMIKEITNKYILNMVSNIGKEEIAEMGLYKIAKRVFTRESVDAAAKVVLGVWSVFVGVRIVGYYLGRVFGLLHNGKSIVKAVWMGIPGTLGCMGDHMKLLIVELMIIVAIAGIIAATMMAVGYGKPEAREWIRSAMYGPEKGTQGAKEVLLKVLGVIGVVVAYHKMFYAVVVRKFMQGMQDIEKKGTEAKIASSLASSVYMTVQNTIVDIAMGIGVIAVLLIIVYYMTESARGEGWVEKQLEWILSQKPVKEPIEYAKNSIGKVNKVMESIGYTRIIALVYTVCFILPFILVVGTHAENIGKNRQQSKRRVRRENQVEIRMVQE